MKALTFHTPFSPEPAADADIKISRKRNDLFRRSAVITVAATGIAIGLAGLRIHFDNRDSVFRQLERESLVAVATVAGQTDPTPEVLTPEALPRILAGSDTTGGVLLERSGAVVNRFGEPLPNVEYPALPTYLPAVNRYVFMVDPRIPNQSHRLILSVDTSTVMPALAKRTLREIALTGGMMAIPGFVFLLFTWFRISRPLNAVSQRMAQAIDHPDGALRQVPTNLYSSEIAEVSQQINDLLRMTSQSHKRDVMAMYRHMRDLAMATLVLRDNGEAFQGNLLARRMFGVDENGTETLRAPRIALSPHGRAIDLTSWYSTAGFVNGYLLDGEDARPCLFSCRHESESSDGTHLSFVDILPWDAVSHVNPDTADQIPVLSDEVKELRTSLNQCLVLLDSYQKADSDHNTGEIDLEWLVARWRGNMGTQAHIKTPPGAPVPTIKANPDEVMELLTQLATVLSLHGGDRGLGLSLTVQVERSETALIKASMPAAKPRTELPSNGHAETQRALALAIIHRLVERSGGQVAEVDFQSSRPQVNILLPAA